MLTHLSQFGNSPCFHNFKMFALRVIFVLFLFGNGFCKANSDLEACEKRVAQCEALKDTTISSLEALIGELKGPLGKFSLLSSL